MFNVVRNSVVWIAVVIGWLGTQSVWAQGYSTRGSRGSSRLNPNARVPTEVRTPLSVSGTVEGVGSAGLQIIANGAPWLVARDRVCKVELTGTAEPEFLKPGLLVRFSGEFDKKGKGTAPLKELEIVSLQNAMMGARGGLAKSGDAGDKKDLASALEGPATYVGKISALKNNELTVETGSGRLKAELGANPTIKVNMADYSFAQVGDKIDVKGWYVLPGAAVAQDIKITLANSLGSDLVKKKPTTKASTKSAEKAMPKSK